MNKISPGAVRILKEFFKNIEDAETEILFCGAQNDDIDRRDVFEGFQEFTKTGTLHYPNLNQAIEWVEEQLIAGYGKHQVEGSRGDDISWDRKSVV